MQSQIPVCSRCLRRLARKSHARWQTLLHPKYLSTAAAITPAPPTEQTFIPAPPLARLPPTQPPSRRPPEFRKSQVHRQYTSLLRSTPLMLLFQHNNLKANEWMAIRRELAKALTAQDQHSASDSPEASISHSIKLQIIQSRIFSAALRVVEYWDPWQTSSSTPASSGPLDPSSASSAVGIPDTTPSLTDPALTQPPFRFVYAPVASEKCWHPLTPLLTGPVAILTFPAVSPMHLKTALSILSPKAPNFPAPTRRTNPGYHDPITQAG
ncbi:MAG: hypothetical protein Q9207_003933, partial [Kuettlingeria erythrocarpa]